MPAVEFPELAAHTLFISISRLQALKRQIERFPLRSGWHPVDIVCRYGRARPHTLQYPLSGSSENARERALQLNRYIQDGFVPSGEEAGFRSFYPASELFRAGAVFSSSTSDTTPLYVEFEIANTFLLHADERESIPRSREKCGCDSARSNFQRWQSSNLDSLVL